MTTAETTENKKSKKTKNTAASPTLMMIPFGDVKAEEGFNVRPELERIKELAALIEENGGAENITPIVVEKVGENGSTQYIIRAGHRRMLALEYLKTPKSQLIPAQLKTYSEAVDAVFENIVENTGREEVHYRDLAKRFYDLQNGYLGGITEKIPLKDIATRIGMPKGTVEQLVRCEKNLTENVKEHWRKKNIAFSTVISWAPKSEEEQEQLLQAWLEEQKELSDQGRKRKKRGSGGGRGSNDDDEDEGETSEKRSVADMRAMLEKYEERDEVTERQAGMIAALKWCLGINELLR